MTYAIHIVHYTQGAQSRHLETGEDGPAAEIHFSAPYNDLKSPVSSNLTLPSPPTVATLNRAGAVGAGVEVFSSAIPLSGGLGRANVTAAWAAPAGVFAISSTSRDVSTSLSRDARVCRRIVAGPLNCRKSYTTGLA